MLFILNLENISLHKNNKFVYLKCDTIDNAQFDFNNVYMSIQYLKYFLIDYWIHFSRFVYTKKQYIKIYILFFILSYTKHKILQNLCRNI